MQNTKIYFCILVVWSLTVLSCKHYQNQEKASGKTYEPTWESLTQHPDPKWFDDAKFGIYWHWGVYSVPAYRTEWYPRWMYSKAHEIYKYHEEHYGHNFGYKDFIPMFTAERFNVDEWADLILKSGAKFAGPVAQHHDGFAMWDSDITEWDVADMGPKRDIMREFEKALRSRGLKFMVSFHHTRRWWYYEPSYEGNYDTKDPRFAGAHKIYPPIHNPGDPPTEEYMQDWENRLKEVVDKYQPDLVWFDGGLNREKFFRASLPKFREHVKRFLAYYYNKAEEWGKEVVVTYKNNDLPEGAGILDIERGRMNKLSARKWLTDTAVSRRGWCYIQHPDYKSVNELVDVLVDIVSKNGNLLLNIGPRPDGTIPPTQRGLLLEIGEWLTINGEAIYGTRPWIIYGEGPTAGGESVIKEKNEVEYTNKDIRFTTKGDVLYAIVLDWPGKQTVIKSLKNAKIKSVSMLGLNEKLEWKQTEEGLTIKTPIHRPGDHAYTFKIEFKGDLPR